ncbi:MAG TPA: hypothetical protein P5307_24995, partial [Pirellulaceae bacterium]|nr:hypothetical protein [Pirellulaceae bacterium]
CPECAAVWDSEWSCACDDECPECDATNISPVYSKELTVMVEPGVHGTWTIWRSPPDAEDSPSYELVGQLRPKGSGRLQFEPTVTAR